MTPWIVLTLLAFGQTLLAGLVLVPWAKRQGRALGLMDRPTVARKIHREPTPLTGGLAIFPAFWGVLWLNVLVAAFVVPRLGFLPEAVRVLAGNVTMRLDMLLAIFAGSALIFLLGLLDDRHDLRPLLRLGIQVAATVPLVATGIVVQAVEVPWLAAGLTVFWLVLLTNSLNFLDNMNGLTSGVSIIVCIVMATIALLFREWYMLLIFMMLAGAVAAFWLHNFPKASIFLGDSGSTHLGFLLGALSILTTYYEEGDPSRLPVLIPLLVLGVPLFDTLSVLWIRFRERKPLMVGDTNHLSHRLVALGMNRTEAVLFIYLATLVVGFAAIPLRILDWRHGMLQTLLIVLIFLLLHWLERVSYRRRNC